MKLFKKYYFMIALIVTLCSVTIYGTYALYTTGADFSNTVSIGTDITYTFDINNMEGFRVSNNSNFRFKGSLTNTIGSTMNYKFYYRVLGATSGVTVKEVASSTSAMKSSGSIANNATVTPEFYIINTSGSDVTVKIGVRFAYSGTDVTIPSNASEITTNITSSNTKTGNCTTTEIDWSSCRTYTDTSGNVHNCKTVSVGIVNTYKFDINNTESIVVSNNDNYRFRGNLTNTVGSTMNYKFYYKVEGASSGVTVKEVASSASEMKSSGSIANGSSKTIEYYITNTSGKNVTVTIGVSFAYNGNTVTLDSGTSEITTNIKSKDATTGSCTGDGLVRSSCSTYTDTSGNARKCSNDALTTLSDYSITNGSTLLSAMKELNNGTKSSFSSIATTDEGIYSTPDDYGTSYYFRGAVTNNYVKFAGAYWRIIRINGDGTIRMIYDGTSANANGESSANRQLSSTSVFNSSKNDNAYVGFMYGSTGQSGSNAYTNTHANGNPSRIKGVLDTWYNGLSSTNKSYIVDRVFCGDRTVHSDTGSYSGDTDYTGDGTGTTKTSYGKYRLDSNKSPKLICPNKNDKYTVSDTAIGNGALSNPVGLITADEVAMAGGIYGTDNQSYYLYTGQTYWTMSPNIYCNPAAYVFSVNPYGILNANYVSNPFGVRPVVNLKSDITFSGGNGSQGAPWIVGTGNA